MGERTCFTDRSMSDEDVETAKRSVQHLEDLEKNRHWLEIKREAEAFPRNGRLQREFMVNPFRPNTEIVPHTLLHLTCPRLPDNSGFNYADYKYIFGSKGIRNEIFTQLKEQKVSEVPDYHDKYDNADLSEFLHRKYICYLLEQEAKKDESKLKPTCVDIGGDIVSVDFTVERVVTFEGNEPADLKRQLKKSRPKREDVCFMSTAETFPVVITPNCVLHITTRRFRNESQLLAILEVLMETFDYSGPFYVYIVVPAEDFDMWRSEGAPYRVDDLKNVQVRQRFMSLY
ncbi:uncharacterized protein [Oscarella lobularis]|uniref:uncharacterized protein n=1 Tax=Oscarella lobularis TaxID=121494 RepID=UPI003313FE75